MSNDTDTEDEGKVEVILVKRKAPTNKKRSAAEAEAAVDEDDKDTKNKTARLTEDISSSSSSSWLKPMQPRPNYCFPSNAFGQRQNFVIYLAIQEQHGSSFFTGLHQCAAAAATSKYPTIQSLCFQHDGTRHITMFQGALTPQQANALHYKEESPQLTPFPIKFRRGWNHWKAGLYLALDDATTRTLQQLLANIQGLPTAGGQRSCDHLSLYRKRGRKGTDVNAAFQTIRTALASHDWGTGAQGVSIRIKLVGTGYDECKVLAGL